MREGWPCRFPDRSPVRKLRVAQVINMGRDGSVSLPGAVLWALALNEGDLVAAELAGEEPFRLLCRGYGRRVRSAVESCGHPWPYVVEFLRLPLAAVGPAGTLGLAAGLGSLNRFEPGEPLFLRAELREGEPGFTLEPAAGRQLEPKLYAEAVYALRVEAGFQVMLPEDALWAMGVSEGSTVAARAILNSLEAAPSSKTRPGKQRLEIGPGGAVPLPERLRELATIQPGSLLRLEVSLSGGNAWFRLQPVPMDPAEIQGSEGCPTLRPP